MIMTDGERRKLAESALADRGVTNAVFLGMGMEGVVYRSGSLVYKILVPFDRTTGSMDSSLLHIRRYAGLTNEHFTKFELLFDNRFIIERYNYEPGEVCSGYTVDEACSFLVECWRMRLTVKDCKPENFIRIHRQRKIRLIDMDACDGYSDNVFLNMCARMFLIATFKDSLCPVDLVKLCRTAINNFGIPELADLRSFINRVFATVIWRESQSVIEDMQNCRQDAEYEYETVAHSSALNFEAVFYRELRRRRVLTNITPIGLALDAQNHFAPQEWRLGFRILNVPKYKVSLLVKTCVQDADTIEANLRHIVRQLSEPDPFFEVVVVVDSREKDFLREFNAKGRKADVIRRLESLKEQFVIDRYIVFNQAESADVYERWFGLRADTAHSHEGVPVASQLKAFEECFGDYILQCDSDILVGRKYHAHSYLSDMVRELRSNTSVLSVGFNIYNRKSKPYFGFEGGGFVPEVRCCLFDRKRLLESRPWPNSIAEDGTLRLTWYRSLLEHQRRTGTVSIRGGDNRTFYVHPQNYRKTSPYAWMIILDRIEQGFLPDEQYGEWDCEGSLYDWCGPKRSEKMVVVSCFRNVPYAQFIRMWVSLTSQINCDFGIILYDDNSTNGLPFLIEELVKQCPEKVTFIKGRVTQGRALSEYIAIRNFIQCPDSVVVMVDGDDALVGNTVLKSIRNRHFRWGADVTVGRVHQTYRIQPHYRYPVNFVDLRQEGNDGGCVYQHLKTFRKYLYDSIPLSYLKNSIGGEGIYDAEWFNLCDDYAMMVPIVEMSQSPLQMDFINYFYDRPYIRKDEMREEKEMEISRILSLPPLNPGMVQKGRKAFRPNMSAIEIDITYECSLHCRGCNRSCTQLPTKERMALADIGRFVEESLAGKWHWDVISILGGEPTLHPDFVAIIELIKEKLIDVSSCGTTLKVVSNGYEKQSRCMLEHVESRFGILVDRKSFKPGKDVEYFTEFNDAPIDDPNFDGCDFSKGCWVMEYCGIGMNGRGYYACAVMGGIDRVLKEDHSIKRLKDVTVSALRNQCSALCRYCGNFKCYESNNGDYLPRCEKRPFCGIVSPTWQELYQSHE